jgi:hypothetical protein
MHEQAPNAKSTLEEIRRELDGKPRD